MSMRISQGEFESKLANYTALNTPGPDLDGHPGVLMITFIQWLYGPAVRVDYFEVDRFIVTNWDWIEGKITQLKIERQHYTISLYGWYYAICIGDLTWPTFSQSAIKAQYDLAYPNKAIYD